MCLPYKEERGRRAYVRSPRPFMLEGLKKAGHKPDEPLPVYYIGSVHLGPEDT